MIDLQEGILPEMKRKEGLCLQYQIYQQGFVLADQSTAERSDTPGLNMFAELVFRYSCRMFAVCNWIHVCFALF